MEDIVQLKMMTLEHKCQITVEAPGHPEHPPSTQLDAVVKETLIHCGTFKKTLTVLHLSVSLNLLLLNEVYL